MEANWKLVNRMQRKKLFEVNVGPFKNEWRNEEDTLRERGQNGHARPKEKKRSHNGKEAEKRRRRKCENEWRKKNVIKKSRWRKNECGSREKVMMNDMEEKEREGRDEGCMDVVADREDRDCVCELECILISVNFTAELTQLSVC